MDTTVALSEGRRRRRMHSAEFKAHIVAACCQPGVSSASVAMANGINANLVRRWVKEAEAAREIERGSAASEAQKACPATTPTPTPTPRFLPLPMPTAAAPIAADIRIELQRGATTIAVTWPVSAASDCAAWMRELLR
ncbi:transposase [uncultured Pseudacidovorax sp.]|uniref:IS66-like element accessory protein TnpA n=1 Tax=uncultured Pseudacidovorax sp. TaxID=679313 RepID=UPI0025D92EF9|nr:transposase [uncultured Pseudacidovorax sp.]